MIGSPLAQKGSILPDVVAGVVSLLRNDADLSARLLELDGITVKVFNNVPTGTVPPYVWVLSGTETSSPQKLGAGHYGRTCTITVAPVSRHHGTQEIDELGSLIMVALERQPLTVVGWNEAGIVWDETRAPMVAEAEGGPQFLRELVFRATAR